MHHVTELAVSENSRGGVSKDGTYLARCADHAPRTQMCHISALTIVWCMSSSGHGLSVSMVVAKTMHRDHGSHVTTGYDSTGITFVGQDAIARGIDKDSTRNPPDQRH